MLPPDYFQSPGTVEPNPADTWRNNNVIMTSKRRRFDVIITLSLRHVPVGTGLLSIACYNSVYKLCDNMWLLCPSDNANDCHL